MTDDVRADTLRRYIHASTVCYGTYKKWLVGHPKVRGYFMHVHKRDFELAGAMYRVLRRKQLGIVA